MTQQDKNKLFDFFKGEHGLLLTGNEIEEIINRINKSNDNQFTRLMYNKIGLYRLINVVVFTLLNLLLPTEPMTVIVWLFVAYNIVHIIINVAKDKNDARKQHRMARKH